MVERLVERVGGKGLSADGTGNGDGPEHALLRNIVAAFAEYERARSERVDAIRILIRGHNTH